MPKFFVDCEDFAGDKVCLNKHAEHIRRVLRLNNGEKITVCDGRGTDYSVILLPFVQESGLFGEVLSSKKSVVEPKVSITLVQALPKLDKMELILQKGTEVGVCGFVPVLTERCVSRPDEKKQGAKTERWQKIAASAAEQSGRGRIPVVSEVLTFNQLLNTFSEYDQVILFYENENGTTLKSFLNSIQKPQKVAMLIGPEGGWSDREVLELLHHGAVSVSLGKRILRTETAGFIGASQLLYHYDE